jgi:hypothetical protein
MVPGSTQIFLYQTIGASKDCVLVRSVRESHAGRAQRSSNRRVDRRSAGSISGQQVFEAGRGKMHLWNWSISTILHRLGNREEYPWTTEHRELHYRR